VFDRLTGVCQIEVAAEGHADFMGLARIPCEASVAELEVPTSVRAAN
jgi:hypothetical protein